MADENQNQQVINGLNADGTDYKFSTTFDRVLLNEDSDESKTLEDLYKYLKGYFSKDMFMMYSKGEPQSEHVKVWYDTDPEKETSNGE